MEVVTIEGVLGMVPVILCCEGKVREAEEAKKAGFHNIESCECECEGEERGYGENPPHGVEIRGSPSYLLIDYCLAHGQDDVVRNVKN
jgi:hypothetical protein